MKKVFSIALMVLVAGSISLAAQAEVNLYYDLSGLGLGLGQTGVFDRQVLATIDATSNYAKGIFPGASFIDVGDFVMGNLTLGGTPISDTEGLNSSWELTGRWSDLTGTVASITPGVTDIYGHTGTLFTFLYGSGTTKLYADTDVDNNFGAGIGSDDDVALTFADTETIITPSVDTELMSLSLISGTGSLFVPDSGAASTGAVSLTWDIIDVPSGVWLDPLGNDLEGALELMGVANVNTLVSQGATIVGSLVDPDGIPGNGDEYYGPGTKIHSRNTGDVTYAVPEPTTMLLLGSGLLGLLGMVGVRRKVS